MVVPVGAAVAGATVEVAAMAGAMVAGEDMEAALMTRVRSMVPPKVAAMVQVAGMTTAVGIPLEHAVDMAILSGNLVLEWCRTSNLGEVQPSHCFLTHHQSALLEKMGCTVSSTVSAPFCSIVWEKVGLS